ncbi:uncharacterized protein LOC112599397 [Melanaphis sacchari]|uniref:uncharacterized protein LOC112599397 n=1 Tax=Melanaphis sacchari TaxID=742174 RepID=UPI000DC1507D|nr:uncharacterized protein LOC112599397 [Melanaphis sacchari]
MRYTRIATADFEQSLLLLFLFQLTSSVVRSVSADRRYDHHLLGTSPAWNNSYIPRAVIHSRFQMTRAGRVIVVSPRFRPGVPFTLGSFRTAGTDDRAVVEPDVQPLPSEPDTHLAETSVPSASADSALTPAPLVNVVDLCIDDINDVVWLLDVGVVDTMTDSPRRVAPAKVVKLEIDDDQDHRRPPKSSYETFEIKTVVIDTIDNGAETPSCLQYITTFRSRTGDCNHYAFVSDAARSTVLVLNTDTGAQWAMDFPQKSTGLEGTPRDILFMVQLQIANGQTWMYTTFMSGCKVFAVNLEYIDRCTLDSAQPAIVEVGHKPYQITVLGTDTGSRMYFRRPTENEIWSWDANYGPFHPIGFQLVSKGQDCRAPVHVAPGYGGFVYVLRNNFADYIRNTTGSMGAYSLIQPVLTLSSSYSISTTTCAVPSKKANHYASSDLN